MQHKFKITAKTALQYDARGLIMQPEADGGKKLKFS